MAKKSQSDEPLPILQYLDRIAEVLAEKTLRQPEPLFADLAATIQAELQQVEEELSHE